MVQLFSTIWRPILCTGSSPLTDCSVTCSHPDQSQRTQKNLELEGTKVISSLFILEVDSAGPGQEGAPRTLQTSPTFPRPLAIYHVRHGVFLSLGAPEGWLPSSGRISDWVWIRSRPSWVMPRGSNLHSVISYLPPLCLPLSALCILHTKPQIGILLFPFLTWILSTIF